MRLIVVRHGESEADLYGVHEGRLDTPLTARGRMQAEACAARIAESFAPQKIYTSTLRRAGETANAIYKACGAEVVEMPELCEHDNGQLAGLTFEEADARFPRVRVPRSESVYGQESEETFSERGRRAMAQILDDARGLDQIAIVCHGGMINRLFEAFFGANDGTLVRSGDTAIHVWRTIDDDPDDRRALEITNDTGHLTPYLRLVPRGIEYDSERYRQALDLRDRELRRPLGLSIYDDPLAREADDGHFGFFDGERLVAYGCATPEGDRAHVRQVVVEPDWRGIGVGALLMELIEKRLAARRFQEIYLHARESAEGFYHRLGYVDRGERFEEVGIPHVAMYKRLEYRG